MENVVLISIMLRPLACCSRVACTVRKGAGLGIGRWGGGLPFPVVGGTAWGQD